VPLVVCNGGMEGLLNTLLASMEGLFQVGLFQNNILPAQGTVIANLTPADFSGYTGLITLSGGTPAAIDGVRWKISFDPVVWTHDGGSTPNLIYGYYAIDGSGILQWAQQVSAAPRPMASLGDTFEVDPTFSDRSEF